MNLVRTNPCLDALNNLQPAQVNRHPKDIRLSGTQSHEPGQQMQDLVANSRDRAFLCVHASRPSYLREHHGENAEQVGVVERGEEENQREAHDAEFSLKHAFVRHASPPHSSQHVQRHQQRVQQQHVGEPPLVDRELQAVLGEEISYRVDAVREDVQARRRGDFGIPPRPFPQPVRPGLGPVENLVQVGLRHELAHEPSPCHVRRRDEAQNHDAQEIRTGEI